MTYNLKMYYFVRFYNNSYPNLFNFLILLISLSIFSVCFPINFAISVPLFANMQPLFV